MSAIGKTSSDIKKTTVVCSDHFKTDSFHPCNGYNTTRRRLLHDAVPFVEVLTNVTHQLNIDNFNKQEACINQGIDSSDCNVREHQSVQACSDTKNGSDLSISPNSCDNSTDNYSKNLLQNSSNHLKDTLNYSSISATDDSITENCSNNVLQCSSADEMQKHESISHESNFGKSIIEKNKKRFVFSSNTSQ